MFTFIFILCTKKLNNGAKAFFLVFLLTIDILMFNCFASEAQVVKLEITYSTTTNLEDLVQVNVTQLIELNKALDGKIFGKEATEGTLFKLNRYQHILNLELFKSKFPEFSTSIYLVESKIGLSYFIDKELVISLK